MSSKLALGLEGVRAFVLGRLTMMPLTGPQVLDIVAEGLSGVDDCASALGRIRRLVRQQMSEGLLPVLGLEVLAIVDAAERDEEGAR